MQLYKKLSVSSNNDNVSKGTSKVFLPW